MLGGMGVLGKWWMDLDECTRQRDALFWRANSATFLDTWKNEPIYQKETIPPLFRGGHKRVAKLVGKERPREFILGLADAVESAQFPLGGRRVELPFPPFPLPSHSIRLAKIEWKGKMKGGTIPVLSFKPRDPYGQWEQNLGIGWDWESRLAYLEGDMG